MKIETSKASGLALDWGLAVAMGKKPFMAAHESTNHVCEWNADNDIDVISHTDPVVCIDSIKSYKINVKHIHYSTPERSVVASWGHAYESGHVAEIGATPEEAVARCIISMVQGETFDVPDDLAQGGQP